ncbi:MULTISPECIES: hypothetical protein [unclassified Bradyrhizobium]|uniref:hypothetical protein n=1 Tax=unclassified Bradyrhizobium TaxID=2631580 RepID=UPI00040D98D0|nr:MULTISPECIES: hypothetical protein [unclassified Bradyrhizobium]MCP3465429.1 hypothetical protein [Bradyrhizobium sp. CCGUVB23]
MSDAALTPSPDAVAALRGHPAFAAAIRACAQSSVSLYRGDRILNALLNDRARAVLPHVALYLHYSRRRATEPGLTVGAMKDLCVRLGLCSRGRCEAMLALMRAAGLLSAAPDRDRRRRPLVPTEKLLTLHRVRWSAHFDAIGMVIPQARAYRAAVDDPAFVGAFAIELGRRFVAGLRVLDNAPELELFAERSAGMMVLFSLALAGPADESFPPVKPVPLSMKALATRFSVSRKHVFTLLRDAEAQGLLRRGGAANDEITILPRGRVAMEGLLATMFLYLAECAEVALPGSAAAGRPVATAAPVV